ncbi:MULTISPECIES: lasso peptide biosynthesis protein [unclassified Corallococcus]|uniref:lasso peptide biosynthesis protein n=1 Tax=unclassified Corallococcus TaxID=2685029 RepID=UPI001A902CBF|nr:MULTISPECIES: lasso peptide biosynthesis protein [unclassified Corallococcus]MBN9682426.1 lasso peptide biosynthesis protein [Corallococcus sp. NCSPR001]WAS86020.1 lasso peptide biosynthesis protein [Corallococcus sp. NCRR]
MKALLAIAMLALPVNPASTGAETARAARATSPARFVFAWRGVPVGTVGLSLEAGRFTYTSRHLHVRDGHAGERVREVALRVDAAGRVTDSDAVPQALWLWRGPPPEGCVTGREELSGQEGPHCVTARGPTSAEGTMLGARFRARYDERGELQALEVGDSRFTRAAPGARLRAPPELFAEGVPVEGGAEGALRLVPSGTVPTRLPEMTEWTPAEARALSAKVHAAFPDKGPSAADWRAGGEGEAGGCLAHALRYASLARGRGQRVGLVHGLLVVDGGPARPHAWVRVALKGGGTLDLDPTSLDPVRPDTHLALALVPPEGPALEAGERWLSLLRGDFRVVRATRKE